MSYLVLARKYRPQTFDDLVGQEHIAQILKNAIQSKRIAHAYLFCGPRGVGKTSCARIMAKCLNAEGGPRIDPDMNSPISREITAGTSFDVLEIDGASNRGIDEIRALRENVKFAPSYASYKIYIVDEVHMLTSEAFNALLKTLEEPPPHVKFIFATTAPNKVPATIISRCQRFDFKRVSIQSISDQIKDISAKEHIKVDDDAIYAIAKAAQGSLRDALSILDQISALSDRKISSDDVYAMLGLAETQLLFDMVNAIGQKNCAQALEVLEVLSDKGKDLKQFSKDIMEHFRHLMVMKVGGKALSKLIDYPAALKEMLSVQSELFSLRDILMAIETLIKAQEASRITESLRMPLEVALAKLTYQPEAMPVQAAPVIPTTKPVSINPIPVKPNPTPVQAKPKITEVIKNNKGEVSLSTDEDDKQEELGEVRKNVERHVDIKVIREGWDAITYAVSKQKMSVATFLQDGYPVRTDGKSLVVGFTKDHAFNKETLEAKDNVQLVEKVLEEKLNQRLFVKYEITQEQKESKDEEPLIKSALNTFKGKVISRWHEE